MRVRVACDRAGPSVLRPRLLVVEPASLSWSQRADLRDAFEASDLPFRVDVVEANALPPGMTGRVAGESVFLGDL